MISINRTFLEVTSGKSQSQCHFIRFEGITSANGLKYYITNEKFTFPPFIDVPQKLHVIDLNVYLKSYLERISVTVPEIESESNLIVYPVPGNNFLTIKRKVNSTVQNYFLIGISGQVVLTGRLMEQVQNIDISELNSGFYLLKVGDKSPEYIKVIKQ